MKQPPIPGAGNQHISKKYRASDIMDDRDKMIVDMSAELERLRRRIAELGSGAVSGCYDESYRLLFEGNPLPLWVYDLETLAFLAVNDAAVRKYGYSREEFLGMTIADIRPREDVPLLLENIARVTEGLDEAGVWRHRRKDGSVIDVEIVSHTLKFEGRKAELVLANDITERRQAEAKHRTIARLYAFLSQINQAIVRTRDRDELFRTICRVAIEFGRFRMAWVGLIEEATGIVQPAAHAGREEGYLNSLSINISDEKTSRGPTGSALRKGVLTICDDIATDPRMLPWRDEALKRGYRSSAAIPFTLKAKVIGSLNLYAAEPGSFTEDERKLLTEIGIDISFALDTMEGEKERRRVEESLYLKNYVFDVAIAANSIADTNGVITQANQAFLTIWGYSSREEVIGKPIPEFLQNADEAAAIIAALHTAGKWEGNYTARKKDGSTFTAFGLATVLRDEQGRMIGYQSSVLDVTESKRMEEALRESEEQYRAIFEGIGDAVFVHRPAGDAPTGRFIAVNDVACRHLGYTREECLSLSLPQVDPLDEAVIPSVLEMLNAGREALFETVHIRKDGRQVPVEVRARTIRYLGAPAVLSVARDISDRKRAEEALRESEHRYRTLFETMAQGVVYQAPDGRIISANPAAERILGVTIDQMQGRTSIDPHWRAIREDGSDFPGDQHPAMEALGTGKPVHDTIMGVFHPGKNEYRWILVNAVPEFLPGATRPYQVYATFTDFTERRRAEEDLRRRTQGLTALLDVSTGLASTLDLETVLQATTDSVTHMSGMGTAAVYLLEGDTLRLGATTPPLPPQFPEELRKAPLVDHPHIHEAITSRMPVLVPDMVTAVLVPAEQAVAEQRGLRTVLFLPLIAGVKPLGTLIVGSIAEPRTIPESEIDLCRTLANQAAIAVENARLYTSGKQYAADLEYQIAERKRAEQERLELERRLLHAQKLESLGILAGGIAHDFNNLLMAVLGNLDLALRKLSPVAPARLNIEQSAQAARRAADLTRQMLAYSGKGSFVVKPMDLSELVEENVHLFRSSVARTTELNVRLDRALPAIDADAGQVQQVIMNLITNASEAIGEGAGMITLATGAQECDSECLKRSRVDDVPDAGRFVVLEVSDNGCGMDEQTQQRLFDPFFTTKAMGRGLGMSAILGIVRGHGGAIFVDSVAGKGTTIRVLFPARQDVRTAKDPRVREREQAAAVSGLSGTVLVVDDEEMIRNVCKEMVEALGLNVLTAVDGRDAVDLYAKHADDIDLVILDLSMPNMDGLAAFEELVRIRPAAKVILSSGYNDQESIQRMSGRGFAGFIQKPYSLKKLGDALEKAKGVGG